MAGAPGALPALTSVQQERMKAAFAAAARVAADSDAAMCERYAEGGPEAVAEAAWLPGGPSREELAALARSLIVPVARGEAA